MKVLLEDKNQTVEIQDGLSPEAMETELRKFYTPEELYGSTTFAEREGYRVRKGRSIVDDGKNWYEAMTGSRSFEDASSLSKEITSEFTEENEEKYQASNWPERFAGATTELAPYMLDSSIKGAIYGEGMGAAGATAAALAGQAGPQVVFPEEIITVPAAYIGGKAVGQAWGTWMNAAKVEGGLTYKDLVQSGIDPQTARNFAAPAGYLIGAIELLQVERLIPGFGREGIKNFIKTVVKKEGSKGAQAIAKFSGRLAKNLAETTALETTQEVTQEIIGITAEVGAGIYEDMASEEGYIGPEADDVKSRLQETITSSLLGFPLLGLPRAVHSTASLHAQDRFADRLMTKKTAENREAFAEFTEQASQFDKFGDFQESLGEEVDDKTANAIGFDNRQLLEEAAWNESRRLQEEHIFDENFKTQQKKGGPMEAVVEGFRSVEKSISRIMEPISTRLLNISSKLKNKMRRYEFDLNLRVLADEKAVKPFLERFNKLSERDKADLDLALKNNDENKIEEIISKNKLEKEYESVRSTLDAIYQRAKASGIDLGYIIKYYPRQIKDAKAMLKFFKKQEEWPEIQKAINKKEEELGRKMTDLEKASLLNTMLRGFQSKSKTPANIKKREISVVTPDINQFYQDAPQALLNYIYQLNDYIEARRFFGKSAKSKKYYSEEHFLGPEINEDTIRASVGNFVLDLLQSGEITGAQAEELSDILLARFSPRGPGKTISAIKNLSYLETMGSITSAVTQIGDIAFSLFKNGFYRTGKALSKNLTGQSDVSKEELGIEKIAEEFTDRTKLSKVLSKVFKWIGFDRMDRLGKETLINSSLERLSKEAEKPSKKFLKEMQDVFGDESGKVIEDLKSKTLSDNVKFLLFCELADFQPIALSEMPEKYLTSGNGRILYMLKTFTIKQIDVFRREAFMKMRTNPAEGIGNLIRLSAMLVIANATADAIKDVILGRPLDSDDDDDMWADITDHVLRLFGLSKYSLYKFKNEGVSEGISSIVLPPIFNFVTRGARDIDKSIKDEDFEPHQAEIVQSIPLLGKLYYWWFGGGRKKIQDKE